MFRKILVPLDTSKMAEEALPAAVELAKAFNSEVNIINVCDPHKLDEASSCQLYLDKEIENLKTELTAHGNQVKSELISGSPDRKILEYVQNEAIDLIFMSSHGRSGVVLWPMGSTVDKVLRRTRVPLIMVKVKKAQGETAQGGLFKRILVALDGSDLGSEIISYIKEIGDKFSSEIILLHVIDTDRRVHNLGRVDNIPFLHDELDSLREKAQEYLESEKLKFTGTHAAITAVVRMGNVAEQIIQHSKENSCSLIALSGHGHTGLEAWFIGSVTNKVLHASTKSIMVVPAVEA